ncbi:hypothetical protein HYW83_06365 [Candidatus Peregrinibacteria bacterium]|nr:hypothetical protein [Candidatus Peregrinibacteria bacterium]
MPEARRESELIMTERDDAKARGDGRRTKQAYHTALAHRDGVPQKMLLVGESERAKVVTEFFDRGIEGSAAHREFATFWGIYHGVRVAVMCTGIGTDNSEIASVELHAVHEYDDEKDQWDEEPAKRTIIRVGTSASPQADVPLGSLGITSHAIGLDNTGLSYLHPGKRTLDDYEDPFGVYYTPDNPLAKAIFDQVRREIWDATHGVIRPYVSTATPQVVEALKNSAGQNGMPLDCGVGAYTGITTSAPGFFGPQGRQIGRLSNVILPDLQDRLARIRIPLPSGGVMRVTDVDEPVRLEDEQVVRAVNNEMEASVLNRLNGEILGHQVGAVCLVIANRNKGEFITEDGYKEGVRRACQVALDAIVQLAA